MLERILMRSSMPATGFFPGTFDVSHISEKTSLTKTFYHWYYQPHNNANSARWRSSSERKKGKR